MRTRKDTALVVGMTFVGLLCLALIITGCGLRVPPVLTDCRTWGCPDGRTCLATEGSWKCVADPAPVPTPTPVPVPTPTPTPVPVPTPTPTPTPVPVPVPTPTPNPVARCLYPAQEDGLVWYGAGTASRLEVVKDGERALGDLRDPRRPASALARENNRKLAAWLRWPGYCVFAGIEAIFIQTAAGTWEEYHAAADTDGGWTQTPYRGEHTLTGPTTSVPPDMPPLPETVAGCGPPTPPPFYNFGVHRQDVRDGWEKFDVTPKTAEGNLDYCTSVGFVNRGSCPARAEEPAWMKGDRLACEQLWLKGAAPSFNWTGAPGDGGPREDNPFGFEHRKGSAGSLSVCLADGTSCQVIL